MPQSIHNLPARDGYDNSITDAWGRELIYTVAEGAVELRSNGADRKPGGDGETRDLIRSFPLKDSKARWSDDGVDWSANTFNETERSEP